MNMEMSCVRKWTSAAPRRPVADNDDDPCDPPPAVAARLPRTPEAVTVVASTPSRERLPQAA